MSKRAGHPHCPRTYTLSWRGLVHTTSIEHYLSKEETHGCFRAGTKATGRGAVVSSRVRLSGGVPFAIRGGHGDGPAGSGLSLVSLSRGTGHAGGLGGRAQLGPGSQCARHLRRGCPAAVSAPVPPFLAGNGTFSRCAWGVPVPGSWAHGQRLDQPHAASTPPCGCGLA